MTRMRGRDMVVSCGMTRRHTARSARNKTTMEAMTMPSSDAWSTYDAKAQVSVAARSVLSSGECKT